MKSNLFTIALASILMVLTSCGKDNYDEYIEDENHTPAIVEVEDVISFGLSQSTSLSNTTGKAFKSGTLYFIGSEDIDAQCNPDGSVSGTFDGMGEYFFFLFNVNPTDTVVSFAGFETEIDGLPVLADNGIVPSDCEDGIIKVDFEENEDRIFGTFSGEFYTFADSIVSPSDSCVNYRSLGILEASFNVELAICD